MRFLAKQYKQLPENAWEVTLKWNPDGEVNKLKQIGVKLRRIVPKNIL